MKLFKYILATVAGITMLLVTIIARVNTPDGLNLFYVIMGVAGLGISVMNAIGIAEELKH